MKIGFLIVVLPIVLFGACSCSNSGRNSEKSGSSRIDTLYGDLSEKEDCILNYERSCSEKNIDRFSELFREDCEFIVLMGKPDFDADIVPDEILRRGDLQNEIQTTASLFAAAHEIRLELESGTWTRLDSLSGEPCADCWETTRAYSLSVSFAAPEQGGESKAMTGQGHMQFIVSPVDDKWKIFKHIDQPLDKQQNK